MRISTQLPSFTVENVGNRKKEKVVKLIPTEITSADFTLNHISTDKPGLNKSIPVRRITAK